MSTTPTERRLALQAAVNESWARTTDRAGRTLPARMKAEERFEKLVDPDGNLPPQLRARMAANARQAHFQRMALKSVQSRRRRRDAVAR
jgi:hypothetical protein